MSVPVIPATPGFFLVVAEFGADEWWLSKYPIVGWRVLDDVAEPIIVETLCGNSTQPAILSPDGQVIRPEDRMFEGLVEFVEHETRRLKKPLAGGSMLLRAASKRALGEAQQ